jgi:hypothetical protein
MDLNKLLHHHQVALLDLANGLNSESRRWAGERADFYASRIVELRETLGVPCRMFDFRDLRPAL